MKKKLFFLCLGITSLYVNAQHVGINTTNPQATLDVRGNQRFGGATQYLSYDSLSGKVEWKNSYLYVPVTQALMKHSAAADGLFYNNSGGVNGQLEYRNELGNPVFFTNFTNGNGYFKNRLGISTFNPSAGLHVADSSVLFTAPSTLPPSPSSPPVSGAGNRMFWYPQKAAFRTGGVSGNVWDKDNIGIYSFTSGFDTKASGTYSTATGMGSTASQGYSTAMGFFSVASGAASTALGNQTTAKAFGSVSIGSLNDFTDNPDPLNITPADRIFQIGNGGGFFPSNAMTVLRNGNIGIGITNPLFKIDVRSGSINTDSVYRIGSITVLNVTEFGNLFVGKFVGRDNTGNNNTFSGFRAGYSNIEGSDNSFFGKDAGFSSISGNNNSFFGRASGLFNTSGSFNSFFGSGAGANNTTGFENSFFGFSSGAYNTTGNNNSFFGVSSGQANTTGSYNSFFGENAGLFNTEGSNNSFIGWSAGMFNTTGTNNSFVGLSAGRSNTTGKDNSFLGFYAGYSNTIGLNNSFFGLSSGSSNTSGSFNSFYGHEAGYSNTTGYYNSFFGQHAGYATTTGDYNSFFGLGAGSSNTTGRENSFVGLGSGSANTTGFLNTAIGHLSLNANTTGTLNTALGHSANVGTGVLTNATAIGANARADCSNCLVLGSVNAVNFATSGVNVGIGVTNPLVKLHVLQGHSGNNSPFSPLVVEGSTNTYINILSPNNNETAVLFGKAENAASGGIVYNNLSNLNGFQFRVNGNSTKMEIYSSGNAWLQGFLIQNSDLRLKKDVHILQNSLQKIMQLNGYNYYWKNEKADNDLQTGVIAQEVQKIFPELVKEDKSGSLAVNYSGLIPVLIESIKDQQKQIEALALHDREQRSQIDELKKLVEKLLKQ